MENLHRSKQEMKESETPHLLSRHWLVNHQFRQVKSQNTAKSMDAVRREYGHENYLMQTRDRN